MSNQNPIHRDRGRRDNITESRVGAKEALAQNEAEVDRQASVPGDQGVSSSSEEQTELQEQAAAQRFDKIGQESARENGSSGQ